MLGNEVFVHWESQGDTLAALPVRGTPRFSNLPAYRSESPNTGRDDNSKEWEKESERDLARPVRET